MKIKLKTQSLDDWELNLFESYSTLPIIIGRTMIFGAYNVDFEMTDNIWHQLPEEYKKKIYKYNLKKMIKSMLITVTDITAYSFCFGCNVKLKKSLIMEEIYKDFDENKKINFLTPGCDFPKSSMSVYFQYLGEVYAEVELDELVAISDEENSFQYSIMPKLMEASNYRKRRENRTGKLEKIYNEQLIIKNLVNKNIDELSKEETQKVLDNFLLIDNLKYLLEVVKKSKNFEIIISNKLRDEIEHRLRDIQIKIKTEKDEKIYQELKEILKEQL